MCKIIFRPEDHTYRRVSDGMLYMPVTHFVKLFTEPFNSAHHSKKKAAEKCVGAKKYKELYDAWCADGTKHTLMPEYIDYLESYIPNWETYKKQQARVLETYSEKRIKGAAKGTELHDWKEMAANMRGFELNEQDGIEYPTMPHGKQADGSNRNVVDRLCELPPGFYAELMIWYDFPEPVWSQSMGDWICGICGQEDRVFILPQLMFDASDHKTSKNKTLDDFGTRYKNYGKTPGTYAFQMMRYPFHHLRDCDKNKYSLQLNTYAWMLDQYHGLTPNSITILHKDEKIPVFYERSLLSTSVRMAFSTGM